VIDSCGILSGDSIIYLMRVGCVRRCVASLLRLPACVIHSRLRYVLIASGLNQVFGTLLILLFQIVVVNQHFSGGARYEFRVSVCSPLR